MTYFPWDEINALENRAEEAQKQAISEGKRDVVDKYIDEIEDLLEMDYMYGVQDANGQLGISLSPDFEQVRQALDKTYDGIGYKDRIREYFSSGTPYDIARVISTNAHRIYNEAVYNTAVKGGATSKTWHCMMLPTSRDTHIYLDGVTVPIDAEFYNYKGESTYYPGQWGIAEEDINCLCTLTFSK